MPSPLIRSVLFLSSYFPLLLIIFLENLSERPVFASVALGAGFVGILGIGLFLLALRRMNTVTIKIASVKRKDAEVLSYIMTYVIKFLVIPWDKPRQVVSLGIFFVMLGLLYVSNNLIHINPTLNAIGFRLFEVEAEDGVTYSILTRGRVLRGQALSVRKAGDDILMEVK